MKHFAKVNTRNYKKISVFALYITLIAALVASSLFAGLNSVSRIAHAMSGPPIVAQRVTYNGGSGSNFGMPTTYDHHFVISQANPNVFVYTLIHNGSAVTLGGPFTSISHPTNGGTGIPAPHANSITARINTLIAGNSAGTRIRVHFNDITLSRNDFVRFAAAGTWKYSGSVVGDLSNNGTIGLVSLAGTNTSRVYFYDFDVENQGSIRFNATDPNFVDGNQHLGRFGQFRARAVNVENNISLFVLGNSNIRATNEAQLQWRRGVLVHPDFRGYDSDAWSGLQNRDVGRHRTATITEGNIRNGQLDGWFRYWLATAYGAPISIPHHDATGYVDYPATPEFLANTNGVRTRFVQHINSPQLTAKQSNISSDWSNIDWGGITINGTMTDWLNSGDFVSDFVSSVTGVAPNRSFIISGINHQTGSAIHFGSSGGLVIDTAGEISSFAGEIGSGGVAGFGTIRMAGTNFTNPFGNGTRLYVRRGYIVNKTFDLMYDTSASLTGLRNPALAALTNDSGNNGIAIGSVIRSDNNIAQTNRVFGNDLLAGGTFLSAGRIFHGGAPNAGENIGASNLTIGCPNGGAGPVMRSGVTYTGDIVSSNGNNDNGNTEDGIVAYDESITNEDNGAASSIADGWILINFTNAGDANWTIPVWTFTLGHNTLIQDGGTDRRVSVAFLNGQITTHRTMFLDDTNPFSHSPSIGTANSSAFDVHLMGGTIESTTAVINLQTASNDRGYIRMHGGNAIAGEDVRIGSTFTMHEAGVVNTHNSTINPIVATGATIRANAHGGTGATAFPGIAGGLLLFYANTGTGGNEDLPLFDIRGGTIQNTNIGGGAAPIINVRGGNAGRAGYIEGGDFRSPAGGFVVITRSANDVVMTGGRFENTGTGNMIPVVVGHGVTGSNAVGSNSLITGSSVVGSLNPNLTGAMFLNGGEIISHNNSNDRGLVFASKSNNTTAIVMGWNRDGFDTPSATRSAEVTRLTNRGNSAMISIADNGYIMAGNVFESHSTSNSRVVIDRVDFNYTNLAGTVAQNHLRHSILAAPRRYGEFMDDLRAFSTLYFTGTLAGLQNNGGVGLSAGFVRAGVNVIEFGDEFDNAGWNNSWIGTVPWQAGNVPFMIENLNNELGVNQSIIRNFGSRDLNLFDFRGYDTPGSFGGIPVFWDASQVSSFLPTLTGLMTNVQGTASYARDKIVDEDGDLRIVNVINVALFTGRFDDTMTRVSATGVTFPGNNEPSCVCFDGLFWQNIVTTSNSRYGGLLPSFPTTFPTGHNSAGLPRLTLDGYTHLGWRYSGYLSPRNLRLMSATGINIDAGGNVIVSRPRLALTDEWVNANTRLQSAYSHMLVAVWQLDAPTINNSVTYPTPNDVGNDTISGYDAAHTTRTTTGNTTTVSRMYDGREINFVTNPFHIAQTNANPSVSIATVDVRWYREMLVDIGGGVMAPTWVLTTNTNSNNGPVISGNNLTNIRDVRDSGRYRVVVDMVDDINLPSSSYHIFELTITRQNITAANFTMPTVDFDGSGTQTVLNPGVGATEQFSVTDDFGNDITDRWFRGFAGDTLAHGLADFRVTPAGGLEMPRSTTLELTFGFYHNYAGTVVLNFVINHPLPRVTFIDYNPTAFSEQIEYLLGEGLPSWLYLVAEADGVRFRYPTANWPTPVVRGYTFVGWFTIDNRLAEAGELAWTHGHHTLTARWELNPATGTTMTCGRPPYLGGTPGYRWCMDCNYPTLSFTFDRFMCNTTAFGLVPYAIANLNDANRHAISYTYIWEMLDGAVWTVISAGNLLQNFEVQQNRYRLRVIAIDSEGRQSEYIREFDVDIKPYEITENHFDLSFFTVNWDGRIHQPLIDITHNSTHAVLGVVSNYRLIEGTDFTVVRPSGEIRNAGIYNFVFTFINNYASVAPITIPFEIVMAARIRLDNISPVLAADPVEWNNATWDNDANVWFVVPTNNGQYPTLPTPTAPVRGYTFVGWNFGISRVEAGQPLRIADSHEITAVWQMAGANVTLSGAVWDAAESEWVLATTFDRGWHTITATPTVGGVGAGSDLTFAFAWRQGSSTGMTVDSSDSRQFMTAQNTVYYMIITAQDAQGNNSVSPVRIVVNITPRDIDDASISINDNILEVLYAGGMLLTPNIVITHAGHQLTHTDFSFVIDRTGTTSIGTIGSHAVTITGIGNYYGTTTATFVIAESVLVEFRLRIIGDTPSFRHPVYVAGQRYYPTLPKLTNIPTGYIFKGWSHTNTSGIWQGDGEQFVEEGDLLVINATHTLTAVFRLSQVEIAPISNISRLFNGSPAIVTPVVGFNADDGVPTEGLNFIFEWARSDGNGGWTVVASGESQNFTNVSDSGQWRLRVIAQGLSGLYTEDTVYFDVAITAVLINAPTITLDGNILSWNAVSSVVGYASSYRIYRNGVFVAAVASAEDFDLSDYLVTGDNRITVTAGFDVEGVMMWSEYSNYVDTTVRGFDWWWLAIGTGVGILVALMLCLGIALKKKGGM